MAKHESKAGVAGPAKGKTAANSLVLTVAIVASLVGANVISTRVFGRIDLTQDHIYKLSAASLDVARNLPDRVNVKAFISGNLPPQFKPVGTYARDLLDEYKAASGGKFDWEAIDPLEGKDNDEKARKKDELSKYKIQPITIEQVSETKFEIGSDNYLGIGFSYGDQVESIPQVGRTEGLEYEITGMLRKLSAAKKRKIGFASTEGELSAQQGLRYLPQVLEDYDAQPVQLDKEIPADMDAVIIAGPKQPFGEKAKFYLDQYLMKGKPVAMFIDGMVIESPKGMDLPGMEQPKLGRSNDVALQDLLEKYGIKVHDDLILDEQSVPGAVPVRGQFIPAHYPTFVGVVESGFTRDFTLTRSVNGMAMPFASSVELVGDLKEGKGDVTATVVARTSPKSWRNQGFFVFNPTQVKLQRPTTEGDKGPFVLGYALEGKFKTAYPGGVPGTEPGTSAPENDKLIKESPPKTRLLVMGNSNMLDEKQLLVQLSPIYRGNLFFLHNVADWLTNDDTMIALRAKGMSSRPLTVNYEGAVRVWVNFCRLGVPLLVIAFGVFLWWRRSVRRAGAVA